jgi:hypothetical protein
MLDSLGGVIDLLTELTAGATDFAKSDLGGAIVRIVVALTALLGVLALAAGAMALMGASSIGVYQALLFLNGVAPKAAASILGTAGAAALADGTLKASAASALAFGRALKALSIVGAILILPDVLQAVNSELLKMRGVDLGSASGALKELANSGDGLAAYFRNNGSIAKNFASDIANSFTGIGVVVKTANEQLMLMANSGNFEGIAKDLNAFDDAAKDIDAGRVLELFPDIAAKAKEAGHELGVVGGKIKDVGGSSKEAAAGTVEIADAIEVMEGKAQAAEGALQEMKDALDAIAGTTMSAAAASDALQRAVNDAWAAVAEGGASLQGTDNASIAFRENLRGIETDARAAATAIVENGGSTEAAIGAWAAGRENIIQMRIAMGESREEATVWADQNLGSAQTVQGGIQALSDTVNAMPTSKHIDITADTWGAQRAIEDFINSNNGRRVYIYEEIIQSQNWSIPKGVAKRAHGGSIWGPGTATSDSIPALLSNGEFVVRTQAAKAIGYGRLDHMNRYGKLPAFAGGGQVGGTGGGGQGMSGEIDLGPRTMRALSRQVVNMIAIDQDSIASAANTGNARSAWRGGRR